MTHAAKRLGLLLAAILALGALAASPALAAEEFHSEVENTTVTGEPDPGAGVATLELEGGLKVECSKDKFEGTVTGTKTAEGFYTSPSVTVRPEYSGSPSRGGAKCDSFIGAETIVVRSHECHDRLSAATVKEGHALISLICPKGQALEVEGGGLIMKITGGPEHLFEGKEVNQNLTGIHYTNTGTGSTRSITAQATIAGIHYTCEPEVTCLLLGVATTGNNAKTTNTITVKGFEDLGGPGAETKGYTEGSQAGIWRE